MSDLFNGPYAIPKQEFTVPKRVTKDYELFSIRVYKLRMDHLHNIGFIPKAIALSEADRAIVLEAFGYMPEKIHDMKVVTETTVYL